jgi:hypothetical protein
MTICDTPLRSLMDSIASPKVITMEGNGVEARSLTHNISGLKGRVGSLGW